MIYILRHTAGRTNARRSQQAPGSQFCWFEFNAADWDDLRRLPTVPQHDRGRFVGGNALDHAAPIGPVKLVGDPYVVENFPRDQVKLGFNIALNARNKRAAVGVLADRAGRAADMPQNC